MVVRCNKNMKRKNHKNVACKNSIIYKKLPIFRANIPYFISVWEKCCGMVIYTKNITVTENEFELTNEMNPFTSRLKNT